ncbi:beta-hexosaminidase subunit beta-like isoform X2 [Ornithodoros turicata]|uniref:beta-hexosaminidase subunit beta-like isoform X2 n=1 Tax=Ornithodoros turicata TaxID=34597 RepID=UPI003138F8AD
MSLLQILWIRVFLLLLGRTLWCFAEITYIEVRLPLPGERAVPGSPWPAPQNWNTSNRQLILDPDTFYVTSNADTCDVIAKAMGRYRNIIFLNSKPICKEDVRSPLPGLHVVVDRFKDEHCQYPRHGQNETYTLEVPDEGEAVLKSQTVWGALRGLETFSQLVYEEDKTGKLLINATEIEDFPRFGFRGILVDSARHFLPVDVIKQNLDAMAYNKFNVLHWHIVDDQSWPLELRTFPNLTESAFSRRYVYSKADVQDIVEYARLRGIRVIPEIDTPGHTQALGKIFPDLLTPCYGNGTRGTPNYPKHAAFEMLDPTKNITYDVVNEILKEVADTFKDEYLHLGMDEVSYDCWKSSPEIKEFMEQHCMSDVNEVEQYYIRRTFEKLEGSGSKLMIWQDPIDNDVQVPEGTLVGVWKNSSLCAEVNNWREHVSRTVRKGYQVVLSACWYLNYISYGEDWKRYYQCDPTSFEGTQREKDLVVGGEATVWGEYIDGNNLIPTLWPRACAVAERLWSSVSFNNTDDASFRLDQQRCRMVRRGISAQPILNGFCSD